MIPKIIHQIWDDTYKSLPTYFSFLSKTWKEQYPTWKYELWNKERIKSFMVSNYKELIDTYNQFPYNIQRWDVIRYLILYKIGGMYVDFDYESIRSIEELIIDKDCCFAQEPSSHQISMKKKRDVIFNNALMLSTPSHPFMRKVIHAAFSDIQARQNLHKEELVWNTTGPWMLMDEYEKLSNEEKENIYIIPAKFVTPFDIPQTIKIRQGVNNEELAACLKDAYAVHYFFGDWSVNLLK
jgi:mannosyltransferase OCH1-like enzyme